MLQKPETLTTPLPIHDVSPWLTPTEAAAYLKAKVKTLAAWRLKGKGPDYCKVGGLVRYNKATLDQWLKSWRKGMKG